MILEYAQALMAMEGQAACGDRALVRVFEGGALIAAVDGLGHGAGAEEASSRAVRALCEAPGRKVEEQLQRCHGALLPTRGATMSIARIDARAGEMSWFGVGNVEGVRLGASGRDWISTAGGVVGYYLPAMRPTTVGLAPGDLLVFATDGVGSGFADRLESVGALQPMAEKILARHRKPTDDALVLVVRYLGPEDDILGAGDRLPRALERSSRRGLPRSQTLNRKCMTSPSCTP